MPSANEKIRNLFRRLAFAGAKRAAQETILGGLMIFNLLVEKMDDNSYMVIVNSGRGDESVVSEKWADAQAYIDKKLDQWMKGEKE